MMNREIPLYKAFWNWSPKEEMPKWHKNNAAVRWGNITIVMLGTDQHGYRCVKVSKARATPLYLRFGRSIEVWKDGKKLG